ncbi:sce7726 family protein [Butyrivibrio sp. VCB2006]|uniref:sce7726 family protein n=1 Tax=Butyrivibrio sp. VCB2006 TaxID=1280679 RepID=UPI0004142CEE|nr:sce7726 family protein [Butyrivibrio sp. VCB2006]
MLRDADIRDGLCDYLETEYGKIRFFEELTMGKSRADIVMVTETGLYGIEIKSDVDTYERLTRQVRDYDRFFDYNFVVVGSSHAGHIKEHVPNHWGIITVEDVDGNLDCYQMRSPKRSPKVKLNNQMGLLWRSELAILQEQNGLYKYPDKSKMYRKKYLMESVDKELLRKQMLDVLFERDYSIFED